MSKLGSYNVGLLTQFDDFTSVLDEKVQNFLRDNLHAEFFHERDRPREQNCQEYVMHGSLVCVFTKNWTFKLDVEKPANSQKMMIVRLSREKSNASLAFLTKTLLGSFCESIFVPKKVDEITSIVTV